MEIFDKNTSLRLNLSPHMHIFLHKGYEDYIFFHARYVTLWFLKYLWHPPKIWALDVFWIKIQKFIVYITVGILKNTIFKIIFTVVFWGFVGPFLKGFETLILAKRWSLNTRQKIISPSFSREYRTFVFSYFS